MNVVAKLAAAIGVLLLTGFPGVSGAAETDVLPPGSAIDGTWRWSFTMPDGTSTQPKLVLEMEEGQLTGTTSFRPGSDVAITNAVLTGDQVRFQVIRRRDDREIITTYSGTWNGKFIRGTIQSNWNGDIQTYAWEARRAHDGAEGIWRWSTLVRGRKIPSRLKLEQDGETLTGTMPGIGRGARRIHITHGSVKSGEIYIEVERGLGENKVLTIYKGKQTGDTIKGSIETLVGGRKIEVPWEALRPE